MQIGAQLTALAGDANWHTAANVQKKGVLF